jgi:hypothetical protein
VIHQLLVYAGNDNVLGGNLSIIRKNTEVLLLSSKKVGPDEKTDRTGYIFMSRQ